MSAQSLSLSTGKRTAAIVPLLLVGIVLLMVVPLPPFALDLLLAASIGLAVALLLVSLNLERPLDLSSLPTILLFSTLLRLSLNVASTRLILLQGGAGTDAAGQIIRAFGEFMIGGNYVVGGAVFILLVIINFVVITKGAGRVAEVSARFTLDSLPGKQMSVDSDLAAGIITQDEAKVRRRTLEQEADFFGAMDGASKFVRGDAIAGLMMTAINIIVGMIVGVAQQGLSAADAASTYTILTVGDGLASQIPALLVSTAAGVVVTRAAAGAKIAAALTRQLGSQKGALMATAGLLGTISLLPGMPAVPFLGLAALVGLAARAAGQSAVAETAGETDAATPTQDKPNEKEQLADVLRVELLELEVGFDLVTMVDPGNGGELVERVTAVRRNLAAELGIIIPSVHIRDNLQLKSTEYRLMLSGQEVGRGELRPRKVLAMDPTGSLPPIDGESVREPAFGLPATWVAQSKRAQAEALGYTVVDAATVAATHLTEMLRAVAPELLGRSEAQELVDLLAQRSPRLVDEVIPNLLSLGEVIKVLRNLLRESVSVRDLRTVFEALADAARETKSPDELSERVRQRLARQISARFRDAEGRVAGLVVDPSAEEVFRQQPVDASALQRLLGALDGSARLFAGTNTPPLMVCSPDVRRSIAEFLGRRIPGLSVISFQELDAKSTVRSLGVWR
ncbi:MAG: flagellar biosynthesis protein FlhA [Polyangiales bacterium]